MKVVSNELVGYIVVDNDAYGMPMWDNANAMQAYEQAEPTLIAFWGTVNLGSNAKCCEVVVGEYRFRVTVNMPDPIAAYMDFVEPKEEPVTPAPEPKYQYIYRRTSDGALWPTFCEIQAQGWELINRVPLGGHQVGDGVLIFDGHPLPADKMYQSAVTGKTAFNVNVGSRFYSDVSCINFSAGHHLTADEREAYQQEATRYQESYYESFNRDAQ